MARIKFQFSVTTQHLHPDLETEMQYIGVASVIGAAIRIECLTATQHLLIKGADKSENKTEPQCAQLAIPLSLNDQCVSGAMGRLMEQCRHYALQAYEAQRKAENSDAFATLEERPNNGFIPSPNDLKYMNAE